MSKIKAFTILEMLMSIGIITLIISMLYFVYVSFSSQVSEYYKESRSVNDTYNFYSQLRLDAYQANTIFKEGDNIVFEFYDNKKVFYFLDGTFLVRKQNNMNNKIYLKDYHVNEIKSNHLKLLINEMEFKTQLMGRPFNFKVNKTYPSFLLQNKIQ